MKRFAKAVGWLILLPLLLATSALFAQQTANSQKNNDPAWVRMMEDPNVNFFEIEKEFNDFWKGKELPIEEREILDVQKNSERKRRFFSRKPSQEKTDAEKYAFAYKKYQWWRRQVLPYVQPDGRILSQQEQVKIVEQQKQLQKQINDKKEKKDSN